MVVYHNMFQPRLIDKSQQTFAEYWLRIGFLQMQHIQSLFKKRIQYDMFLHKKCRSCNGY